MQRTTVSKQSVLTFAMRVMVTLDVTSLAQAVHAAEPSLPEHVEFNRDVRPILADHCLTGQQ
jgi:hypothetical protein